MGRNPKIWAPFPALRFWPGGSGWPYGLPFLRSRNTVPYRTPTERGSRKTPLRSVVIVALVPRFTVRHGCLGAMAFDAIVARCRVSLSSELFSGICDPFLVFGWLSTSLFGVLTSCGRLTKKSMCRFGSSFTNYFQLISLEKI